MKVRWSNELTTTIPAGGKSDFAATNDAIQCSAIIALKATRISGKISLNFFVGATKEELERAFDHSKLNAGSLPGDYFLYTYQLHELLAAHQRFCKAYFENPTPREHIHDCRRPCLIGRLLISSLDAFKPIISTHGKLDSTYVKYKPYGRAVSAFHKVSQYLESISSRELKINSIMKSTPISTRETAQASHDSNSLKCEIASKSALDDDFVESLRALLETSELVLKKSTTSATLILLDYKSHPEHTELNTASRENELLKSTEILRSCGLSFEEQKLLEKFRHKCLLDLCQFIMVQIEDLKVFINESCPNKKQPILEKCLNQVISSLNRSRTQFIVEVKVIDLKYNSKTCPKALALFPMTQKSSNMTWIKLLDLFRRHVALVKRFYICIMSPQESHIEMKQKDEKIEKLFHSRIDLLKLSYSPKAYHRSIKGFITCGN